MRKAARVLTGALAALLLLAPGVEAQLRTQGDRAHLEARVRARMAQLIRERLELSEEEGARLSEIMEESHRERRELRREERSLRQRLSEWAESDEPADGDARAILERMAELREAEAGLFRAEQERLLDLLTPGQVLTFHMLRDRMAQRLRELRGGRGPDGPPGRGPPRPGGLFP